MRKKGFSYSEIEHRLYVPKSTLSSWLKGVMLTDSQVKRLKEKRFAVARANSEKRILKTSETIEAIKISSARDIRKISKRELWLMGIILYWRERILSDDVRKGVRFTSSDAYLIRFFLKWLKDIGGLQDDEIGFDIFIPENKKESADTFVAHWATVTGFPEDHFSHIYFQKVKRKRSKRKTVKKAQSGLLRIRVRASSMLARQIAGWIHGIQNLY